MPKPWKRFNEYSQSGLNKLKRHCTRDEPDDELYVSLNLQQPADPDQDAETSEDFEHFSEQGEANCEALSISSSQTTQSEIDNSEYDSDGHHVNVEINDSVSDLESNPFSENEDSDREDFDRAQNGEDEPLYEGARISVEESLLSILNFSLRHNVSGVELADLLSLIEMHCPPVNNCVKSLYSFRKHFSEVNVPLIRHFYCKHCYTKVEKQDSICPSCVHEAKSNKDYFIEVPIVPQIQALFKRPGFRDLLQHRYTRERKKSDNIDDIYDGAVYKELSQAGGFLANENNISFTWYTDGITIFKSSKFSIWPIYLTINELPFSVRTKKENTVLAALWFGDEKPVPNLFLEPLLGSARELRNGIEMHVPNAETPIVVKGMIICGTCDLPAKALFLNMKQYNGKFGCQKCKQEGKYLAVERVLVYPYEQLNLRTDEETRQHAVLALNTNVPVYGVKGPTILTKIVYQNMRATAVDVMHCVYEGVVKNLMDFWFSPAHSKHPSSLIGYVELIDQRIASLTPPSSVQRSLRSIQKHLHYMKAYERKAWLHYWSIPCIQDFMRKRYLNHYLLLVFGIGLLVQSSISPRELHLASRALKKFVSRFERLYHLPNMTNNLHQLLHLVENVRQFGPLWTTSCFPFEDLNGRMKSLVHGSKSPQLQVQSAASTLLHLTTLKSEKLIEGTSAHAFCENLDYKRGRLRRHCVSDTTYILGNCEKLLELPPAINEIFEALNIQGAAYFQYSRLLKRKIIFSSTQYMRSKRTDSSFALYAVDNGPKQIGRVRCFIRVADCHCNECCHCNAQNYAIVKPCILENRFRTCIDQSALASVHNIVAFGDNELAVKIERLESVCFYSEILEPPGKFIIEPVNTIEFE